MVQEVGSGCCSGHSEGVVLAMGFLSGWFMAWRGRDMCGYQGAWVVSSGDPLCLGLGLGGHEVWPWGEWQFQPL